MDSKTDSPENVPQAITQALVTGSDDAPKRHKTAGEVLVERGVFTGVGLGVNEALSLGITYQFVHGQPKKWLGGEWFSNIGFKKAGKWLSDLFKLEEKIGKKGPISPQARGENMLLMATLYVGGSLLVWPMKAMKDHEEYLVRKANHFFDWMRGNDLNKEEVAARDAEVDKALACKPKQSWPSLLAGRIIAIGTSWVTGTFIVGPERNDRVQDFSKNIITHGVGETNKLFGGSSSSGLGRLAKSDKFAKFAGLVGVETYSCTLSSLVLEFFSKLVARHRPMVHNPELCAAPLGEPCPASTSGDSENRSSAAKKIIESNIPSSYADKAVARKEMASSQAQVAI